MFVLNIKTGLFRTIYSKLSLWHISNNSNKEIETPLPSSAYKRLPVGHKCLSDRIHVMQLSVLIRFKVLYVHRIVQLGKCLYFKSISINLENPNRYRLKI